MRILHLVQTFPPSEGGAEGHVFHISKELTRRGHEVEVFTSNWIRGNLTFGTRRTRLICRTSGLPDFEFEPFKVSRHSIVYLGAQQLIGSYDHLIPGLLPALFKTHPDVVHIHSYGYFHSDLGARVSYLRRIPFVLSPHGFFTPTTLPRSFLKTVYNYAVGRFTIRKASKLIVHSPDDIKHLARLGARIQNIEVVPPGVDCKKFGGVQSVGKFRERFSLLNTRLVVFASRLEKRKGVQYLLKAAPKVREHIPNVKFLISGRDWGYGAALRELVSRLNLERDVIFTGFLPEREHLEAIADADVFVLPSENESFPRVLLEAMATGVPVIASNVGGIPHIIKDKLTGVLVPVGDVNALADEITSLLSDENKAEALSSAAKKHVEKTFSWETTAERLENVYLRVVDESR